MPNASINFSASVTVDDETKTISSSGTLAYRALTSGSQTVGNTYEAFATSVDPGAATVIIYNTGTVDVSIRITTLSAAAANDYQFLNCIAGGILVIHPLSGDGPATWSALSARTSSSTSTLDYCIIR
jgi:hypothetical protein